MDCMKYSILKAELELNGIDDWLPDLIPHEALLSELDYALSPLVHEGRIRPFGFISMVDGVCLPEQYALVQVELADARKLVDGCHSFLLFLAGKFEGVLLLDQKIEAEWELVDFQQLRGGILCRTTVDGITQIFCDKGTLQHQLRRWYKTPSVQQLTQNIVRLFPQIDRDQLQAILDFCLYELSPDKIGTILVWYLEPVTEAALNLLLPQARFWQERRNLEPKLGSAITNAVLQHVVTYTDGAVILEPGGIILGVGAHLKYSTASIQAIAPYKGTRHTSARRFTYDYPETIAFVVSDDGSVTVFAAGKIIAVSEVYATKD